VRRKDENDWMAFEPRFSASQRACHRFPFPQPVAEFLSQDETDEVASYHADPNGEQGGDCIEFASLNQSASADDGQCSGNQVAEW
jgi:hypothetical protein